MRAGGAGPSRRVRRFVAPALLVATLVAAGATAAGAGGPRTAPARDPAPARRVLIFSMPYVSWSDLDRASMPNLDRFLRRAAVAGLTTRVDQRQTPLADGYATIGAGTRTIGDPTTDSGGLMTDERFGVATAGDIALALRLGAGHPARTSPLR